MSKEMKHQNTWFFLGGIAAAVAGKLILKSDTARKVCVTTLAQGMKMQKEAKVGLQNIKEDAEDLCYEARQESEAKAEADEAKEEQKNEI
ncbi:DUF1490 domain-containing protein [Aminipila sp.]|jgi:hypothetical protein|uniref:DUF1490 domain-containing protein n=1 Tax=Aminipila sp. TaxID=2060095 RepID=UPI001D85BF4E|nr:DUF1490 domain-containing protein [Aminipila sp.]MBE6035937.1 DUF1490 domain-containing protein [Clostridiales bacterium]